METLIENIISNINYISDWNSRLLNNLVPSFILAIASVLSSDNHNDRKWQNVTDFFGCSLLICIILFPFFLALSLKDFLFDIYIDIIWFLLVVVLSRDYERIFRFIFLRR